MSTRAAAETRISLITPEEKTALLQIQEIADLLTLLTAGWYPNEYHFVSENLYYTLLDLQSAARKLNLCEEDLL